MKHSFKLLILLLLVNVPNAFAGNTFRVDTIKSGMTWHMPITSGEHYGTIKINSGYITFDGTNILSGSFNIDMNSVKDLDLSREKQPAIEKHIKSEDFFEAAKYPFSTFKIDRVEKNKEGKLMAYGTLTIKGICKQISFPIRMRTFDNKVYVDAEDIKINRKDFGITIKNKGLKGSMEEAVIYDTFKVGFSIALK